MFFLMREKKIGSHSGNKISQCQHRQCKQIYKVLPRGVTAEIHSIYYGFIKKQEKKYEYKFVHAAEKEGEGEQCVYLY